MVMVAEGAARPEAKAKAATGYTDIEVTKVASSTAEGALAGIIGRFGTTLASEQLDVQSWRFGDHHHRHQQTFHCLERFWTGRSS